VAGNNRLEVVLDQVAAKALEDRFAAKEQEIEIEAIPIAVEVGNHRYEEVAL
jgi:hypothetical protein